MEVNDPDLDAFESTTCALLRARELGKIKAFIPNLQPKAPVPESMGKSSHINAPLESQYCAASSHKHSDLDKSLEDLEKSTEWIFQGYLFFCSNGWRTDETYEAEVRALVEQQYLPKVPVSVQHMAIFYDSVAKPDRDVLKLPIRGYVQANSASRQQWRKWIDAAELEWEKAHGGILYNKWYLFDCQETYTGNPKRLLLRHGQYQNFRVNGTLWTFSSTICVDLAGDESCYLVEITRAKFMEAQGLATGHQLSNTCLSTASPQFSHTAFSKLPQRPGISCGNAGFLTSSGALCRGGLCCNAYFEKALAEIQLNKSCLSTAIYRSWSSVQALGR